MAAWIWQFRRAMSVVLGLALLGLPAFTRSATAADPCSAPANAVVAENCLPGSPATEWDVSGAGDPSIQGFTTSFSVDVGETVHFKVDTDAAEYSIDVYRMGYYGGAGARHIATLNPTATLPQVQPPCLTDSATGLVDCGSWSESASWAVPASAVSGVYIARLTRSDTGGASHVPFVVRNDASHSDLLFQTSDTTWQAYNTYGGNSLYTGAPGTNPGRAYKVSYNRPFTTRGSTAEDSFFNAEFPMVRWLEENGYDLSYIGGGDVDAGPVSRLEQHHVFMSVGHDEYWSANQRTNVEAARDAGVNLAFFSGNQIFWKTRWEPSIDGTSTAGRTLVSYKETHAGTKIDPDPAWTGTWRDPLGAAYDAGRPENGLAGTIFMVNCCTSAITVPASDEQLRIWRNSRLSSLEGVDATLAAGTLGYEWNEDLDNGSRPAGEIDLSSTTASEPEVLQDQGSTYGPGTATHSITMYRASSGALVFDAGTVQWSWGLDGTHDRGGSTPDSAVQQATVNLFADMSVQPATLQSGLTEATASTDTAAPTSSVTSPGNADTVLAGVPLTVTGSASDSGGGRVAGVEVSTDGGATWHPANGHASWTYTFTPQTTGSLTIRARATDDSVNTGPPSTDVTVTVAPHGCPCTIWDNSATPASVGNNDGVPIDYGVKFRTDSDGSISGFRFYKSPGDGGTHTGNLWDTNGNLLASMSFVGESASGWQEVDLTSPVSVSAGTTYIGSVFSSAGYYPDSPAYFAGQGVDNPPLHALASGVDGLNAVYHEGGTDAFPDQSFNASNYWADVVFSTGPDTTPPVVTSRSPTAGATDIPVTHTVSATFDEPMNPATISASTFTLRDAANGLVAASVQYDTTNLTATLTPSSALVPSSTYTARVIGGVSGAADAAGNPLSTDVVWSFATAAPPADDGPGGPILVIGTSANPFGRYYGEILRAEGLNEYRGTDIANVTPTVLSSYHVVVLGEMTLTPAQTTMLSNWVTAGGKLVAMRPDNQLAGLLGLSTVPGSASNAYLRVDTSASPGQGITDQTIQYHGTADHYQLAGAASLGTLYSDASTATSYPAVTLHAVGSNGGQAAAFTYDLARSIVYTRQGNPAWSGQERDGQPPIRADDLFFGAATGDPQPDWVNLDKVAIPQADEQQRLLANLVLQMESSRMPLPKFWYLPRGEKAVVVMTGDDHGNGGTAGRFDEQIADSPAGCSVANWQCIRSTSYVYPNTPLTDAQAAAYTNQGFEVGLHVTTDCADWTPQSLADFYNTQLAAWRAAYPSLPGPFTSRTHCIANSDYSTQPHVELANGIRLDTNYYFWPPEWVQDRPGFFTGSGLPMRFADPDGSVVDVYQAATQMTDESGQSYPHTIDTLLDNALGPLGYYGVFTANMHTDSATSGGADAIISSAEARNVPVVSARQMLDWVDGRNSSSFSAMSWSGHVLTFNVTAGASANGLQAMLPMTSADGAVLTSITRSSSNVAFTTETIKGVSYAVFDSSSGAYTATYTPDTTPPVISGVAATATPNGDATITWTTNEASNSSVAYGTNASSLSSIGSDSATVTSHSITLHGLVPGTSYSYRVTSTDRAGNSSTSPPTSSAPAAIIVPTFVTTDTTVADFSGGTVGACAVVAHAGDGEVELSAAVGTEFSGTQVPSGWDVTPWDTGGTVTVGGGVAGLNGARLGTTTTYSAGRSLEFVATFTTESFQHIGFGIDYNAAPWAMFSTGADGTTLKARTNDGTNSTDTVLGAGLLGSPHRFRIDWGSSQVVYSVDGAQVATHAAAISTAMRPLASDLHPDANQISLDWLQLSPHVSTCSFVSRAIDGGNHHAWISLDAAVTTPAGTSIQLNTRTSNDAATWSAWTPVTGTQVNNPAGRYLQYQAVLTTTNVAVTPSLTLARLASNGAPAAPTGVVGVPGNGSAVVSWTAPATNNGSAITGYVVTPYVGVGGAGGADVHVDGDVPDDHRADERDDLHVRGGSQERQWHGAAVGGVRGGDGGFAGGTDRCRWRAGERVGGGVVDGAGQQRVPDHGIRGDALHRIRPAAGADVHVDGDVPDDHRVDQRDDLQVHGGGQERQWHGAAVGGVGGGDGGFAAGADRCRWRAGEWVGGGVVDGAGEQQRVGDHRVCGDAVCGVSGAGGADVHLDGDVSDDHRVDERDDLHVQGGGQERQRHGAADGGVGGGDGGGSVAPTGATAVPGNGSAAVSWTAPANNGSAITGIRGDAVCGVGGAGGADVHLDGDVSDDHRVDERDDLHVHGGSQERQRHGAAVGGVGGGDGGFAGGADRCRWRAGERVGGGVVDGAGQQRVGDHGIRGDAVCGVSDAGGADVHLDGDVSDDHRVDERDDLHVHGGSQERQRHGAAVGGVGGGDGGGACRANGGHRGSGERVGGGVVDGAGQQRVGDHGIRGDAVCGVSGAGGADVHLDGDVSDDHRVDERDDLHVQGGGQERQRHGAAVGGVGGGDGGGSCRANGGRPRFRGTGRRRCRGRRRPTTGRRSRHTW